MIVDRSFPNTPQSVGQARSHTRDVLGAVDPEVADTIALMVSELATNCIRHAVTHYTLTIDQTPERVRVAVTDTAPGIPTLQTPPPTSPTGRGLQIVREFADDWGIAAAAGAPGKTVWFTVGLAPQRSPSNS